MAAQTKCIKSCHPSRPCPRSFSRPFSVVWSRLSVPVFCRSTVLRLDSVFVLSHAVPAGLAYAGTPTEPLPSASAAMQIPIAKQSVPISQARRPPPADSKCVATCRRKHSAQGARYQFAVFRPRHCLVVLGLAHCSPFIIAAFCYAVFFPSRNRSFLCAPLPRAKADGPTGPSYREWPAALQVS